MTTDNNNILDKGEGGYHYEESINNVRYFDKVYSDIEGCLFLKANAYYTRYVKVSIRTTDPKITAYNLDRRSESFKLSECLLSLSEIIFYCSFAYKERGKTMPPILSGMVEKMKGS